MLHNSNARLISCSQFATRRRNVDLGQHEARHRRGSPKKIGSNFHWSVYFVPVLLQVRAFTNGGPLRRTLPGVVRQRRSIGDLAVDDMDAALGMVRDVLAVCDHDHSHAMPIVQRFEEAKNVVSRFGI